MTFPIYTKIHYKLTSHARNWIKAIEKKVDFQYVNILRLNLENTDKQNTNLGLKGHNKF